MLVLLLALLLLLLLRGPGPADASLGSVTLGPDLPLNQAPEPLTLFKDASDIIHMGNFLGGEALSQTITQRANMQSFLLKSHLNVTTLADTRHGVFFMAPHDLQLGASPMPSPYNYHPVILPSASHSPAYITIGSGLATLWAQPEPRLLPLAGAPVILAGHAGAPGEAQLLTLDDSAGALMPVAVMDFGTASTTSIGRYRGPVRASPGQPGTYYLMMADHVGIVWTEGDVGHSVFDPASGLSYLLATRLATAPPAPPDLVLVYAAAGAAELEVRLAYDPRFGPAAGGQSLRGPFPAGIRGQGHFLNPPPTALLQPHPFLYYVEPGPPWGIWRVEVTGDSFHWRQLTAPAGLAGGQAAGSLAMLHVPTPAGPRWVLATPDGVLFDNVLFGCDTDPTIECRGPGQPAPGPLNWVCRPGRALSLFAREGRLCAGCADGFHLSSDGLDCLPCWMANCQACNADHCLVCREGWLLEGSGPGGQTICVEACSPGFRPSLRQCVPASGAPATGAWLHGRVEPLQPLGQHDMAAFALVAETRITVRPGSLPDTTEALLTREALDRPAAGQVLLYGPGAPGLVLDKGDIGAGTQAPALPLPPGILYLLTPKISSFVEMGPFVDANGQTILVHFFCSGHGTGDAWVSEVRCTMPPGPGASCSLAGGTRLSAFLVGRCVRLSRADERTVVLVITNGMNIIRLDAMGRLRQHPFTDNFQQPDAVALPRARGPGAPALPMLAEDWLVLLEREEAGLFPLEHLPLKDARGSVLRRKGLHVRLPAMRIFSLPTPDRARQSGEVVFSGVDLPPGGPASWLATHMPLGSALQGRTSGLSASQLQLAQLPAAAEAALRQDPTNYQILPVGLGASPGGHISRPSGLVLLLRTHVGLAPLQCDAAGLCRLGPASFVALPEPLGSPLQATAIRRVDRVAASAGPASGRALASGPGGDLLTELLVAAPGQAPLVVALEVSPCPEGTFGVTCEPCHALCAACVGPLASDCTLCRHFLPSMPDRCLAACPEGLHPAGPGPSGQCDCHADCRDCTTSDPPLGRHVCVTCPGGMALPEADPLADRCHPCHSECGECRAPGDEHACRTCARPGAVLYQGSCLDECPAGMLNHQGQCVFCPAACRGCQSPDRCQACEPGHFLTTQGQCHPCAGSCLACDGPASCTACLPGLIFLSPDPEAGSLCGSICPPGEFPGPGRCTACGSTCVLCAGGPDRCQVCAPGHRWQAGPPAAGDTAACVPCLPGCLACTPSTCLECAPGLVLLRGGACATDCPAGSHSNGESCQPCDVSCDECAGPAGDQCTECAPGLDMVAEADGLFSCASGCPEGRYRDTVSGSCEACDPACATCNGPSDRDCWRCTGGLLQDGQCVQECAAKHAPVAGRCLPCHASCAACAGTRSTECLPACPGELLALPAGQSPVRCVASCPVGYSTAAGGGCSPCGRLCVSCPADTQASTPGTPASMALFQNEVAIMWLLRQHPNIVRLYGYGDQPPAIVMERYQADLDTLLHSEVPLAGPVLLDIVHQWATGLEAMHAHGVAHCDLKPANIFLTQQPDGAWHAALGDLGTSRNLSSDRSSTLTVPMPELNALTGRYAAPEVIAAFRRGIILERDLFLPADIFSAAIMLWECLGRMAPWAGNTLAAIFEQVTAGGRPAAGAVPVAPELAPVAEPLRDLLTLAWAQDPLLRPSAQAFRQRCTMCQVTSMGGGR
ncbi:TKL protein kinase [Fonticula alba]|uniref:TKL protein kinase n=1 Tax=Fonticula alba TaxID=691883 RepID=A0A058Z8D1_FONAL|nr:TKL protein kinase [Fonticula alba]KCV69797.1 TKL protein kinase [Fonticula alba]|eukprot:XP_009495403.1 TKL protein kinase [Fonticula alba]